MGQLWRKKESPDVRNLDDLPLHCMKFSKSLRNLKLKVPLSGLLPVVI